MTIFPGFVPDFYHMRRTFPNGSFAMATALDGGGDFNATDWLVGLYIGEGMEPVSYWSSEQELTVEEVAGLLGEWEATSFPTDLFKPITDRASADAWIEALHAAGMGFHFDDDPGDIVWNGGREATAAEADLLRYQRNSLYAEVKDWGLFDCPIGYLLAVEAKDDAPADPDTVTGEIQAAIRAGKMPGYERLLPKD